MKKISCLVGLVDKMLASNVNKSDVPSEVNLHKWNAENQAFYEKEKTQKMILNEAIVPKHFTALKVKQSMSKMSEGEQAQVVWAVHQVYQLRDFVIGKCKTYDHGFDE